MKINLTEEELTMVNKLLNENNRKSITTYAENPNKNKYAIDIDEDLADEIRDYAADAQLLKGFKENYELNKEGEILEKLVDKFFIG